MTSAHRHVLRVQLFLPPGGDPGLHARVLSTLEGITPRVQAVEPDAADLDVTGALRFWGRDVRGIGQLVQLRTAALYGLHDTTVGAGPNRMIAAMAADATPPGGMTVIGHEPRAVAAFLRPRPVAALYGVGPATAATLAAYGLYTIGALADTPLPTVQRLFGAAVGRNLHERAHGRDLRPVTPAAAPRQATAEHRFDADELDPVRHRRALLGLAERLGAGLRDEARIAGAVTLTVRYADGSTTTRTRTLTEPTHHSAALARSAYGLYERLGLQRARVRRFTLGAEGLRPAAEAVRQLTFDPRADRALAVEAVADRARARYGRGVLGPATLAGPPG
ncbi:DNA polymerase Y family protein [Streptomyces sp. NPDC001889]